MRRIAPWYFLVVGFGFFLGLGACEKGKESTVITGAVVDSYTRQPLDSVYVEFSVYHKNSPPNNVEYQVKYTDSDGKFSFQSDNPCGIFWVLKSGYLPKGLGTPVVSIEQEKENEVIIDMIPKDGTLKLDFNNNTGAIDSLYVTIYSPIQDSILNLSNGIILGPTFFVQGLSPDSFVFNLASEQIVDIYWGSTRIFSNGLVLAPHKDSFYITRNDTTTYTITY